MTLVGLAAQKLSEKKRNAKLAEAFPNGVRCQKCLDLGHWSYECKAQKRKFLHRSSRTKQLNKRIDEKVAEIGESNELGKREASTTTAKVPKAKRSKQGAESSSSSSSSDESDTDDDSDSDSSSDSDSGSDSDTESSSDSSSSSSSSSSSCSSDENAKEAHLKKTKIENKTSSSASSNEGADN